MVRARRDARHGESVRVDAAGVSAGKSARREPRWQIADLTAERSHHRRGSSAAARSIGKTEYIEVPKGAFYAARVCSDADLLDTVLNMLERM